MKRVEALCRAIVLLKTRARVAPRDSVAGQDNAAADALAGIVETMVREGLATREEILSLLGGK